jgi:hypothetical protein
MLEPINIDSMELTTIVLNSGHWPTAVGHEQESFLNINHGQLKNLAKNVGIEQRIGNSRT